MSVKHEPVSDRTQSSKQDLDQLLTHRRVGVYAGVDPTAPSIHVGHMVPFMVLGWFYIHGYDTHFVVSRPPQPTWRHH